MPTEDSRSNPVSSGFINRGIANALGAPVDIIAELLRKTEEYTGAPVGSDYPIGGSRFIADLLRGAGAPVADREPETMGERVASNIGEIAGLALPANLATKALSHGKGITAKIASEANAFLVNRPVLSAASEVSSGVGFGIGQDIAKDIDNPIGKAAVELTAGTLGALAPAATIEAIARTGLRARSALINTGYSQKLQNIDEKFFDQYTPGRLLQDQSGGKQYVNKDGLLKVTGDETDWYLQRRLAEAKINNANQGISEGIDLEIDYLKSRSKDLGRSVEDLSSSADKYLYSKHAKAYNKSLGDGAAGITNKEADEFIRDFETSGMSDELKFVIESRTKASRKILDTLIDGGLVSKELGEKLRKQYPDYVPLNRIMSEDGADEILASVVPSGGNKYETTATGLRRARGSQKQVRDIVQNIYENLSFAVRRAEVNKANLAFKRLLEANPETSGLVATIERPKIIGTRLVKDESEAANAARLAGENVKRKKVPVYQQASANDLVVFEGGQKYHINFANRGVAAAFKGTNKENIGSLLRASATVMRHLGSLYTRFNPEFPLANMVRDRQEATINNLAKMSPGTAIKTLNPAKDMGAVRRSVFGIAPKNQAQAAEDALYREFKASGGSTGGLSLSTMKHVEEEISKLVGQFSRPKNASLKSAGRLISGINEVIEDGTRFATFKRGIESGMTRDQAALAARNSSFDPLLSGTEGDAIKALWMFSNPALQGMRNFARSMRNPKVAASVIGGLVGIQGSIDAWNQSIDPAWRDKVNGSSGSKWKTNKNFVIVTGTTDDGELSFVTIPVSYSLIPIKVAADMAQRFMGGQEIGSGGDIAKELAQETLDAYNPAGGSLVPTILKPAVDIYINKDGLGRDIRPSWLEEKNMSETEKIFPWTAATKGGEYAMVLAENLKSIGYEVSPENLLYLYQTYTGGPGKTVERLFDVTAKLFNGEKILPSDVPIARRFYGETFSQAFELRTGEMQAIDNIDKQANTTAARNNRIAYGLMQRFKDSEDPRVGLQSLVQDVQAIGNEGVARRVASMLEDEAKGMTSADKRIRNLGIENGDRTRAYIEIIKDMTPEDTAKYLNEQRAKGNLTDVVAKQLSALMTLKATMPKDGR